MCLGTPVIDALLINCFQFAFFTSLLTHPKQANYTPLDPQAAEPGPLQVLAIIAATPVSPAVMAAASLETRALPRCSRLVICLGSPWSQCTKVQWSQRSYRHRLGFL